MDASVTSATTLFNNSFFNNSYAWTRMRDPANNPVNDLQIIKLHISWDIPWKIDPKSHYSHSSLIPKQEPNKDNSKNGFLPYLSLNGPIIRRPNEESQNINTNQLENGIGTK